MAVRSDVCVIGAGLVGLSVAHALVEAHDGISVLILDKEDRVAAHQSSHNSGVVHSGLYYRPGSLKARLCVEGRRDVYLRCEEWGVPHARSGKLVIATRPSEIPALDELETRGKANGLGGLRRLRAEEIRETEPSATGLTALLVPEAGVADYEALANALAADLQARGAEVVLGAEVRAIENRPDGVSVITAPSTHQTGVLVNCAGLFSDRIAAMAGVDPPVRVVPFRGEYYRLTGESAPLVRALVYPVPDPRLPFLGVHFTRRVDGAVEVGPNAVLALGRENYRGAPRSRRDVFEMLRTPGFWRLAGRHWRSGFSELVNSRSRRRYARLAQALVPAVQARDLVHGGSGVRAQAVGRDGSLADDFVIERAGKTVHILNAPSPGATASMAIGRHVAAEVSHLLSR